LTVWWKNNLIQRCAFTKTASPENLNWWRNLNSTKWSASIKTWNLSYLTVW
jgi:hypothetical protein